MIIIRLPLREAFFMGLKEQREKENKAMTSFVWINFLCGYPSLQSSRHPLFFRRGGRGVRRSAVICAYSSALFAVKKIASFYDALFYYLY